MKKLFTALFSISFLLQAAAQVAYTPAAANIAARKWFSDARFGLFIHWGPFSIPGSGEWVMNDRNITVANYTRLQNFFNPVDFNAVQWVSLAKSAGMKYITLVTRHHDGFSMWDTRYSDFSIMHTPYKKDIVKMIADECHKQGIKLFLYYSLLDWRRNDYSWWTGRTGKGTGRRLKGDWKGYIQFMKDQLTELLTRYGEIGGIWFDGYWDQLPPDDQPDAKTVKPAADWHLDEIYSLIHKLQPQCLIGNNHHLSPLPEEDFQMFEKDLPGGNTTGFGGQAVSALPLESCETINNSWGFNLTDTAYKTHGQLIAYLVRNAGFGANFLLNIGPMPNGGIQPEFVERLQWMGRWLKTYGESIYHTTAGYLRPQEWGCLTQNGNKLYVHILKSSGLIELKGFPYAGVRKAYLLKDKKVVKAELSDGVLSIKGPLSISAEEPDTVVVIEAFSGSE